VIPASSAVQIELIAKTVNQENIITIIKNASSVNTVNMHQVLLQVHVSHVVLVFTPTTRQPLSVASLVQQAIIHLVVQIYA
jgi:hypothetical protein